MTRDEKTEWTPERIAALLEPLTGYTPGPLFHDGWTGVRVVGAVDTWSGPVLATIVRCEDTTQIDGDGRIWECDGDAECNARLIAAAPDLVDALRAVAAERDAAQARAEKAEGLLEYVERQAEELRGVLAWYDEQARLCRLVHSGGDAGRHALSNDGGKRARAALAQEPAKEGNGVLLPLTGDASINQRCATEGCGGQPAFRFEAGGVGSYYCSGCASKIAQEPGAQTGGEA